MRKNYLLYLIVLFSLTISAQKEVANPNFGLMLDSLLSHSVDEVLPKDIKHNEKILFLDSREKNEFNTSHIEKARWVGFSSFKINTIKDIPKDQKIVVYCTVGFRSEKVAEKLIKAGFTNVSNLYGGIFEWAHSDFVLVNQEGVTEEVHTYDESWAQWLDKGIKKF